MIVQADAKALEWWTAVWLSQDPTGLEEIRQGIDLHTENQRVFNLPSRLIAKKYLFRTIYKGSPYAFSKDPEFKETSSDIKFWEDIEYKFYKKYDGLNKCHIKWGHNVTQDLPIVGPQGREWQFEMKRNYRGDLEIPWTIVTNYPIQGTAADIMAVIRVLFYNRLHSNNIKGRLIGTIHDSILIDVPEEFVQQTIDLFHECFQYMPTAFENVFGVKPNIPLLCECKFGEMMYNKR